VPPAIAQPNAWMILPFGLLLALIALAPLCFPAWWARHYPKAALSLGAITIAYYLAGLNAAARVLGTAEEYFSFIVLIGSLFVVSGGIRIQIKGEATPLANVGFLLFGALLANVLGTTGASMLLIRPWLRMNKYRITAHHVVFFIFIVSNVGGCLTPIGDPPLFLGYLRGIPFSWVFVHAWPMWVTGVGLLLAIFFVIDRRNYLRAPQEVRERLAEPADQWRLEGGSNFVFLGMVVGAVLVNRPHFLREALMLAAAAGSYLTTRKAIHQANELTFHPIREVAVLFAGIFATMIPALDWLQANAGLITDASPGVYFWASGVLSSVLDNAPTYLSFLSASIGQFVDPGVVTTVADLVRSHGSDLAPLTGPHAEQVRETMAALQRYHPVQLAAGTITVEQIQTAALLGNAKFYQYVLAISIGAVFFGANTYIGNGPNFMVKAIADHQKVRTPGFFGYVFRFTLPFMLPMLAIVWWLFFRD